MASKPGGHAGDNFGPIKFMFVQEEGISGNLLYAPEHDKYLGWYHPKYYHDDGDDPTDKYFRYTKLVTKDSGQRVYDVNFYDFSSTYDISNDHIKLDKDVAPVTYLTWTYCEGDWLSSDLDGDNLDPNVAGFANEKHKSFIHRGVQFTGDFNHSTTGTRDKAFSTHYSILAYNAFVDKNVNNTIYGKEHHMHNYPHFSYMPEYVQFNENYVIPDTYVNDMKKININKIHSKDITDLSTNYYSLYRDNRLKGNTIDNNWNSKPQYNIICYMALLKIYLVV